MASAWFAESADKENAPQQNSSKPDAGSPGAPAKPLQLRSPSPAKTKFANILGDLEFSPAVTKSPNVQLMASSDDSAATLKEYQSLGLNIGRLSELDFPDFDDFSQTLIAQPTAETVVEVPVSIQEEPHPSELDQPEMEETPPSPMKDSFVDTPAVHTPSRNKIDEVLQDMDSSLGEEEFASPEADQDPEQEFDFEPQNLTALEESWREFEEDEVEENQEVQQQPTAVESTPAPAARAPVSVPVDTPAHEVKRHSLPSLRRHSGASKAISLSPPLQRQALESKFPALGGRPVTVRRSIAPQPATRRLTVVNPRCGECAALEEQVKQLEIDLTNAEADCDEYEARYVNIQEEGIRLHEVYEAKCNRIKEMTKEISALKTSLEEKTEEADMYYNEYNTVYETYKKFVVKSRERDQHLEEQTAECRKLEKEMALLRRDNEKLRKDAARKDRIASRGSGKQSKPEAENKKLKAKLLELQQKNIELTHDIELLHKKQVREYDESIRKIRYLEGCYSKETMDNAIKRCGLLSGQVMRALSKIEDKDLVQSLDILFNSELDECAPLPDLDEKSKRDSLLANPPSLLRDTDATAPEVPEAKSLEMSVLEAKLLEKDDVIAGVQKELEESSKRIEELNGTIEQLRTEVTSLEEQKTIYGKDASDAEEELTRVKQALEASVQEKKDLQWQVETAEVEKQQALDQLQAENVKLQEAERRAQKEKEDLAAFIDDEQAVNAEVVQELEAEVAAKEQKLVEYHEQVKANETMFEEYRAKEQSLQDTINQLEGQIKDMESKIEDLEGAIAQHEHSAQQKEKTIAEFDRVLTDISAATDALSKELIQAKATHAEETAALTKEMESTKQQLSVANSRIQHLEEEASTLQQKHLKGQSSHLEEVKEMSKRMKAAEESNTDLKRQVESMKHKIKSHESSCARLDRDKQQLSARLDRKLKDLKEAVGAKSKLEKKLKEVMNAHQDREAELRSELMRMEGKFSSASEALEHRQHRVRLLEQELEHVRDSEDQTAAIERKLAQYRAEKETAERRLSDLYKNTRQMTHDYKKISERYALLTSAIKQSGGLEADAFKKLITSLPT